MIVTKLISKVDNICKFKTRDGREIVTDFLDSLVVGEIYHFKTDIQGFSTISDKKGNTYNVIIL